MQGGGRVESGTILRGMWLFVFIALWRSGKGGDGALPCFPAMAHLRFEHGVEGLLSAAIRKHKLSPFHWEQLHAVLEGW
eukprot:916797-Amphidinium_carterae.1